MTCYLCEKEFPKEDLKECGYCKECCERDHQGWHCNGCGCALDENIAVEGEYCGDCY